MGGYCVVTVKQKVSCLPPLFLSHACRLANFGGGGGCFWS